MSQPEPQAEIVLRVNPPIDNPALNELFAAAWPRHRPFDFGRDLAHALVYICAYAGDRLVGYVRVAWDGSVHGFLLEPTVHPDFRRRGIGTALVAEARRQAAAHELEWLHVDYEPELDAFYKNCGFVPTLAGLIRLKE
jgi:GNAT superfamily N-acetyltransferase